MEKYDFSEIESTLEGMSLHEKIEYLEEVQDDISTEIDNLESVRVAIGELLDDVVKQVCDNYRKEIFMVLNDIMAVYQGGICALLPDNTLDISGLLFRFYRYSEMDNQLFIDIQGKKAVINTGDFNAELSTLIKHIFPAASYNNLKITITNETDFPTLLKNAVEKLINNAPQFANLAVKYKAV